MRARRFGLVIGIVVCLGPLPARASEPTKLECIDKNARAQDARREAKFSDARALLVSCTNPACPAAIRSDCSSRLEQLDAAQPTIVFDIKDESGVDVVTVRISVDGAPIETRLGSAIAIDPGTHHVTVEATGYATGSRDVVLAEGEKVRRERIVLVTARPVSTSMAAPTAPSAVLSPPATPLASPAKGRTQQTLGVVTGATGLGGLGAGIVLGLLASGKRSDQIANCESSTSCADRAAALDDHASASGYATASTVGFVAGGLLVAAGVALYLTAPPSRTSTGATVGPNVGLGSAGVSASF